MEKTKKQKNRTRALVISIITIIICLALLAGGTYALWTKKVTVTNHLLVSGKMDLTLTRTKLVKHMLDESTGYMKDVTDENAVELKDTTTGDVNVFGLAIPTENKKENATEHIVPTSAYTATLEISNPKEKSDVAFTYNVYLALTSALTDGENNDLAEQITVSVYADGDTSKDPSSSKKLSAYISTVDKSNRALILAHNVAVTKSDTFAIKIEFDNLDSSVNNLVMDQTAIFDIVVEATQATTAPVA